MLKKLRILLASLVLVASILFFIDFSNALPSWLHIFQDVQLVPSFLAKRFFLVGAILLATLLLGRIYCSVICPLGIFQDLLGRIYLRFNKKRHFRYIKEHKILKWSFLAIFLFSFFLNVSFLVGLLEPYSIFGRIFTHIFSPVYLLLNNMLAYGFNFMGNYSLYRMDVYIISLSALIVALLSLLLITVMTYKSGRLFCNTLCPVGTFLGFISKYSFFKVRFAKDKCNSCGLCARACKASCINSNTHEIDYSSCVDCYNCLYVCKKNALAYTCKIPSNNSNAVAKNKEPKDAMAISNPSRRSFFTISSMTLVSAASTKAQDVQTRLARKEKIVKLPIIPPGGKSFQHLAKHCTSCHLCVAKCPTRAIKPSLMEYGMAGVMLPMMTYDKGFCNFDCTLCSEICPTNALQKISKEEKHHLKIGDVKFLLELCIVYTDNTSCGACSEHCPTQAVSMIDYKDGLTIPYIEQDICVGCGGCESICPSIPQKAIYIEGFDTHKLAQAVEKKDTEEVDLDGFGF